MEDNRLLIRKYALKNALEFGEAQKDAVIGKVFADKPELKESAGEVVSKAEEVIGEVNSLSEEELKEEKQKFEYEEEEKDEEGLPELPAVEESVTMRIAPFPSGMLHIGNARMAVLNDEYVERYGGKLYLVIDDTAGSEEKKPLEEAYKQIPKDLEWLGVEFDEIIYKSDRLELFYEHGERFLEEGWAYVCNCDAETLRDNRKEGRSCEHRDRSPEENLEEWNKMQAGEYSQGDAVVRLKTDMEHKNPAFRDRVLFRISDLDHPRVGDRYDVWPMLEFSWAVDDHELGMTHIIRGKDLVMETKMERFMWDLLDWPEPEILHHGLLNLQGVKLSTSESRRKIDSGEYHGWEDPRTWSLISLRKRGFQPEAIRNFVLSFGMSDNTVSVSVDNLYTENRKIMDEMADRYFFVDNPRRLEIEGVERTHVAEADLHPEFPDRGSRNLEVPAENGVAEVIIDESDYEQGKELRLKDLFNIKITDQGVEKVNESLDYALDRDLDIVQWLPAHDNMECKIMMPDGSEKSGLVESNIEDVDQVVQFIRFGFCRVDSLEPCDSTFCYFTHS
ncbi:MAG: glutamate--tRNA ligase [Candidatus Nanohaloarchaea archaeon]|nr:glutamate--tRNA ligase [Candidatus Nanohaloarchaea archaeon]